MNLQGLNYSEWGMRARLKCRLSEEQDRADVDSVDSEAVRHPLPDYLDI